MCILPILYIRSSENQEFIHTYSSNPCIYSWNPSSCIVNQEMDFPHEIHVLTTHALTHPIQVFTLHGHKMQELSS